MFGKIFFFVLFGHILTEELFSYTDCGGTKISFQNISLTPLPIKLSETNRIWLSAKVQITDDLPTDALAELKIKKLVDANGKLIEIEIPCVDGMGSCSLKVCDLFTKWYNDLICPFMKASGIQCQCPIQKGTLSANNIEVGVPFSQFKGIIAWLASGPYNITFRITDPSKTVNYSCLRIHATLDLDQQQ